MRVPNGVRAQETLSRRTVGDWCMRVPKWVCAQEALLSLTQAARYMRALNGVRDVVHHLSFARGGGLRALGERV